MTFKSSALVVVGLLSVVVLSQKQSRYILINRE